MADRTQDGRHYCTNGLRLIYGPALHSACGRIGGECVSYILLVDDNRSDIDLGDLALTSGALAGNPLVPGIGCAEPAHLYLVLASHGTKKAATFMQHVV